MQSAGRRELYISLFGSRYIVYHYVAELRDVAVRRSAGTGAEPRNLALHLFTGVYVTEKNPAQVQVQEYAVARSRDRPAAALAWYGRVGGIVLAARRNNNNQQGNII